MLFSKVWAELLSNKVSKFKGDIYDDIVERESDWTFDDYGYGNFVVEWKTLKIYAVDFTSYRYMPDREERRRKWKQYTEKNKWELGMVLNNGSITHWLLWIMWI